MFGPGVAFVDPEGGAKSTSIAPFLTNVIAGVVWAATTSLDRSDAVVPHRKRERGAREGKEEMKSPTKRMTGLKKAKNSELQRCV